MSCIHPVDLDEASPNAAYAARHLRRLAARRTAGTLRSALTPSLLLPAVLLAFGCYALLTLTGSGPRSWQVRLCAERTLDVPSCRPNPGGAAASEARAAEAR